MANTNRDILMTIDVKTSKVSGGGFSFFVTDQNTSNFFVRLVMSMSTNAIISQYVTLEKANSYQVRLFIIKPNNNLIAIDGTLMNEKNALFQFNLPNDYKDQVGTYTCEFHISSTLTDGTIDVITTDPFTYTVKPSILNNIAPPTDAQGQPVILAFDENGNLVVNIGGEERVFGSGGSSSGGGNGDSGDTEDTTVPTYHTEEISRVVQNIWKLKSEHPNSIVFGTISDNHVDLTNQDVINSATYGAYAMGRVGELAQADFIANLGDNIVGTNIDDDTQYANFKYMEEVTQYNTSVPFFNLVGNHCKSSSTQKIYDVIGAYNEFDVYSPTRIRGFGYKDFTNKKVRVITLNTCDYWNIQGGNGMSYEQKDFFMRALDLSTKSDYAKWTIVVLSHIPLDFLGGDYNKGADLKAILKAYNDGGTCTITIDETNARRQNESDKYSGTLTYNYSGKNTPKLINIHGHVHTNCYGKLKFVDDSTTLNMFRMSTANSNFNQNASTDRYTSYGDYSITKEEANKILKYKDCAKDTSATFYVIDLDNDVIYSVGYGADIDRQLIYGDAKKFNVTYSLTDVSSSNSAKEVIENNKYTTTLSVADSNFAISNVKVTMGGTDITSSCYSNGVITITSVTGDIVITASAVDNYVPVWDLASRQGVTNVYETSSVAHACVCSRKNWIAGIGDTGIISNQAISNIVLDGNDITFTSTTKNFNIGLPYQLESNASYTVTAKCTASDGVTAQEGRIRVATFDNTGLITSYTKYDSGGSANPSVTFTAHSNPTYWTVIMLDPRNNGATIKFSNVTLTKN
jgi:hypothetical protein